MNDLVGEVSQVAEDPGPAAEVLRHMISAALRSFASCTAAIRALDGTDAALGERGRAMLRRRARQIREAFAAVLDRGVAEGAFRPLDAEIVSRAMLGAVRMTSHAEETPGDGRGLETLIDLLLHGLTATNCAKRG